MSQVPWAPGLSEVSEVSQVPWGDPRHQGYQRCHRCHRCHGAVPGTWPVWESPRGGREVLAVPGSQVLPLAESFLVLMILAAYSWPVQSLTQRRTTEKAPLGRARLSTAPSTGGRGGGPRRDSAPGSGGCTRRDSAPGGEPRHGGGREGPGTGARLGGRWGGAGGGLGKEGGLGATQHRGGGGRRKDPAPAARCHGNSGWPGWQQWPWWRRWG